VNTLLVALGLAERPLPLMYNWFGVTVALTHVLLPFMILTLASVIEGIPESLEDTAAVLGAGWWSRLSPRDPAAQHGGRGRGRHARLHAHHRQLCVDLAARGSDTLVLPLLIYQQISLLNNNFAAALGMLLLVLSLALLYAQARVFRVRAPRDGPLILRLYCSAVLAFLSLPIVVAVGVAFGSDKIARFRRPRCRSAGSAVALSNPTFITALGNSVVLAALTTLLTIVIGLRRRWPGPHRLPGQPVLETFLLSPLSLRASCSVSRCCSSSAPRIRADGVGHPGRARRDRRTLRPPHRRSRSIGPRSRPRGDGRRAGRHPVANLLARDAALLRPGLVAGGLFAFLTSFDNVPVSIFLTTARTTTLPVTIMSYLVNQDFDPIVGAISAVQGGAGARAALPPRSHLRHRSDHFRWPVNEHVRGRLEDG